MRDCSFCGKKAWYRDRRTGQYLCPAHVRLEVIGPAPRSSGEPVAASPLSVRAAVPGDYDRIAAISLHFWDETDVDCFDRQYDVLACPAYVACAEGGAVGMASYAVEEAWGALVLVMLNILPDYQRRGGG